MKIGYSFWGFINSFDIADTPDGGRAYRYGFVKTLLEAGHEVTCLQQKRDKTLQKDIEKRIQYSEEFPEIDALLLEWRWIMPGRNFPGIDFAPTRSCELDDNLEPDYDRQESLLQYYLLETNIPILILDTDLKMSIEEEKRLATYKNRIIVLDPSIYVDTKYLSRYSWFFPFDFTIADQYKVSDPEYLISYVGNNYEKDEMFEFLVEPLSRHFPKKINVFGNWKKYPDKWAKIKERYPLVEFHDKLAYTDTIRTYNKSLVSLFLPKVNYMLKGSCSVRLCESFIYKSMLLVPRSFLGANLFRSEFVYDDPKDAKDKVKYFESLTLKQRSKLIDEQLNYSVYRNTFDVNHLVAKLISYIEALQALRSSLESIKR